MRRPVTWFSQVAVMGSAYTEPGSYRKMFALNTGCKQMGLSKEDYAVIAQVVEHVTKRLPEKQAKMQASLCVQFEGGGDVRTVDVSDVIDVMENETETIDEWIAESPDTRHISSQ